MHSSLRHSLTNTEREKMDSKSESMEEIYRKFASENSESDEVSDLNELRIVLLGISGAGKSAIGNAVLGQEVFKENKTRESEKQRGSVKDRKISIIDTPGFFNTQLTDEELQEQMLKSLYLSLPGPHVFLLVINLETFREEQRNTVEQIQESFGEEALKFTMVLFIGREKFSRTEWIQITESENMKALLSYFEGRFHALNSKIECDPRHTIKLIRNIDEMVNNNGGQHYSIEIYLKRQKKCTEDNIKTKSKEEQENQVVDLRIVLVGKTGSGKSSTSNTIFGSFEFNQGISTKAITRHCQRHLTAVEGRNISVIDTPGLYDTSMSEEELKAEIEKCINMSAPGPHAFLLVIRLDDRFTEEQKNTVKWIQNNFGEEAARYTIILFTHADALEEKSLDEYIQENPDQQTLLDICSGRYHSFNNKDMRKHSQVKELLEKIEQMVVENGGQHYTSEIYKKAQENIEWEAWKQNMKDYGRRALTFIAGGAVGAVAAVGGVAGAVKAVEAAINIKVKKKISG